MRPLDSQFLPSLEALYQFEGDLLDEGGGSLDLSGTVEFSTLSEQQGVWLDTGDVVSRASNDASLTITGELTLQVVLYANGESSGTEEVVIEFFSESPSTFPDDNVLYRLSLQNGTIQYTAETGGTPTLVSHDFEVGTPLWGWHLLTITRDGFGDVILYIDGELAGVASSGLTPPTGGTNSRLRLGSNFRGFLGAVAITSQAASSDEVRLQYNHVFGPDRIYQDLNPDLVPNTRVYWSFNETLTDEITGLTLSIVPGAAEIRYLEIQGLQAFHGLKGLNPTTLTPYLQAPRLADLDTVECTVHILAYIMFDEDPFSSTPTPILMSLASPTNDEVEDNNVNYLIFWDQTDGELRYFAEFSGGSNIDHSFEVGPPINDWHLYSFTRSVDGSTVKLYIDGEEVGVSGTGLTAPTFGSSPNQVIRIGTMYRDREGFIIGGYLQAEHESSAEEVRAMWSHVSNTKDKPKEVSAVGGIIRRFTMRAFNSSLGRHVVWNAFQKPDFTGTASSFNPGDLSDFRILHEDFTTGQT